MKKIFIFLFSLLLNVNAYAVGTPPSPPYINPANFYQCVNNYYVSNSGSNLYNGTSPSTPWLSIGHAVSALQAISNTLGGYCVNVAPGTYNEEISLTGVGGSNSSTTGYLVFRSTSLHGATIQIPSGSAGSPGAAAFIINSVSMAQQANYIAWDGFTIAGQNTVGGSYDNGISLSSSPNTVPGHHYIIINNIMHDQGGAGVAPVHDDYMTIEGNLIYNTSHTSVYQTSGIGDYQAVAYDAQSGPHNIIAWNVTHDNKETYSGTHSDGNGIIIDNGSNSQSSGIGCTINITASGGIITSGTISNGGTGGSYHTGAVLNITSGGGTGAVFMVTSVSSGIVTGISLYVGGTGYSTTSAATTSGDYVQETLVENNISYNNGGGGIHIFETDYVTAINNTAYNNYTDTSNPAAYRGGIDVNGGNYTTFANNISYALAATGPNCFTGGYTLLACNSAYLDASGGAQNQGNIWYNNLGYTTNGKWTVQFSNTTASFSSIYGNVSNHDPLFNNLGNYDFTLTTGSLAIDAGISTYGYPAFDINGQAINPLTISMGAYQIALGDSIYSGHLILNNLNFE